MDSDEASPDAAPFDGRNEDAAAVSSKGSSDRAIREFSLQIPKTESGFGIVFAKRVSEDGSTTFLVVDGFADDADAELQDQLQLGDELIGVNEIDCRGAEVMHVVRMLRSAPTGANSLQFYRQPDMGDNGKDSTTPVSIKNSVMGALLMVKSKIKAEIDGDAEELLREQQENELFEKQWLGEFDKLRVEYQVKWDTCTHSADEFCGLLYHSSDEQQQQYLLREYPTLMEAWRDADLTSSSLRIRPDWPAAKVAYDKCIKYASPPSVAPLERQLGLAEPSSAKAQPVEMSPSLSEVVSLLRSEFYWSERALLAFSVRLETAEIYSCADLLACMAQRHGAYFERAFQSRLYPRLTHAISERLRIRAHELQRRMESTQDLCMEPLRVNPH